MRKIELKSVELKNGERLSYRHSEGGSKTILLVHGNLASSVFYEEIIKDLPDEFSAYAVDMRGFGDSTYNRPIDTLRDLAGDLKLFVEALNLKKFDLLGWSTGGAVSLYFTSSYPKHVNRLFLIASAGVSGYHSYEVNKDGEKRLLTSKQEIMLEPSKMAFENALNQKDEAYYKKIWQMAIYNKKMPEQAIFEKHIKESLKQQNLIDIYHGLNSFNISDYYNGVTMGTNEACRITVPVTMIQGDSDLLVSVKEAEELRASIGENARLIVASNCGHSPMVDAHEIMVNAIVNES